jgi:hypothetical protein
MNWDDYIYPVDIKYDRKFLYNTISRIRNWPIYSADRGKTFFSTHSDIYFPANAEAIKIKNSLLNTTTFSFSFVPPGHETGWHRDLNRGCTLILPLDNYSHLIKFKIDNDEHDYYYDTPVVTNAKTYHNGVNYTSSHRYNLLFHYDIDYYTLVENAKNNLLQTEWVQDYNICLTFDFDRVKDYFNTHSDIDTAQTILTNDATFAKTTNKFTILLGDRLNGIPSILYEHDTPAEDIINAIKYIIDNPGNIKLIDLGK